MAATQRRVAHAHLPRGVEAEAGLARETRERTAGTLRAALVASDAFGVVGGEVAGWTRG